MTQLLWMTSRWWLLVPGMGERNERRNLFFYNALKQKILLKWTLLVPQVQFGERLSFCWSSHMPVRYHLTRSTLIWKCQLYFWHSDFFLQVHNENLKEFLLRMFFSPLVLILFCRICLVTPTSRLPSSTCKNQEHPVSKRCREISPYSLKSGLLYV